MPVEGQVTLKEEFLRLLEKDKEFRLAVAGLVGYSEVLERLREHDKKFTEILARLEEHDKKFVEVLRRLEEHDKKFAEILGEIRELREDFNRLSARMDRLEKRVEVTIGSMGRRWGVDLERMVLEIFKETLEERGIEAGKVEKLRFVDEDGSLTGVRGRIVDVDVLVRDEKLFLVEVKSRAEIAHVEDLFVKAGAVEKHLKRRVDKVFLVAINVDKEAYERALELGIDVVCGHVIE